MVPICDKLVVRVKVNKAFPLKREAQRWGSLPVCAALKGEVNLSSSLPSGAETEIVGGFRVFAWIVEVVGEVEEREACLMFATGFGAVILVEPMEALLSRFMALHHSVSK